MNGEIESCVREKRVLAFPRKNLPHRAVPAKENFGMRLKRQRADKPAVGFRRRFRLSENGAMPAMESVVIPDSEMYRHGRKIRRERID